jgi:hypothetical protein
MGSSRQSCSSGQFCTSCAWMPVRAAITWRMQCMQSKQSKLRTEAAVVRSSSNSTLGHTHTHTPEGCGRRAPTQSAWGLAGQACSAPPLAAAVAARPRQSLPAVLAALQWCYLSCGVVLLLVVLVLMAGCCCCCAW